MENVQNLFADFKTLDEKGDIFKQMFDLAVLPILIHDMEMNIIQVNESACTEFGYTKEEFKAIKVFDLHTAEELQHSNAVLKEMETENKLTVQTVFQRKDGTTFHAEATPCKYILEGKPIIHVFIQNTDYKIKAIQKQQEFNDFLERTVHEKTQELLAKNVELENFAYIASHDLKEPLFTITSLVTLLKKHLGIEIDEKSDQFLNYLQSSSNRMREIIDGILDYSKLGQNRQLIAVNTAHLVQSILTDLNGSVTQKAVQISYGELPTIVGLEVELRLLFQNLISNAIKFRKADITSEINISAEQKEGQWIFSIKDNGIGIPPKHQHEIFALFKRLHSKSHYEGTGIGLAHCKKIVQLHQGEIWVESKENEGSSFYFSIPV